MAGSRVPAAVPARRTNMRPPPRPSSTRLPTAPSRARAASPAESVVSLSTQAGSKRKEREFDRGFSDETNINVFVRCRGRNGREVRENSAVVLSTEGVRGQTVELMMGPSALSKKTYSFDKVFAPAADQSMIYDDVVTPILKQMMAGFNCTIFAYGQTGTGKTYTMTGDMETTSGMLSEDAGIIPRTLYALFNKLELDEIESSVKCSFIELYNEELRDLISVEETAKLKIFEDTSKRGQSSTIVQGMEETFIKNAAEGFKLLQAGSYRRQVAATKCNDLSSRGHTVFTITASIKHTLDNGEDYVSTGKLNLVDLAGSENIQRSGAENKRAAEAGLINKSLLTLGRVINALVDKNAHVPYRESKLTRLLQDSLGGRTKTCIIATVSPAKSNLEETISTLDYAFRAKNIRNKPQVNQLINKKTLLREYTSEIEKLKSELIATRLRNGVYLSNEDFEQLSMENESRRILSEEQAVKIEAMEINLRNKVQELFTITNNFMSVRKENETTRLALDETKSVLDQTEIVLASTQKALDEETTLRKAHQRTEEKLSTIGNELISTVGRTVDDIGQLRKKIKRKSDLQSVNRNNWTLSQAQVSSVTGLVESRVEEFQNQQEKLITNMSSRMQAFVHDELEKLAAAQAFMTEKGSAFDKTEQEVLQQSTEAKEKMDAVLEEIKTLREDVKKRVAEGLKGLTAAAERISAEVVTELTTFHSQLHGSYTSIGQDFKSMFEELSKHLTSQREEVNVLREQLRVASEYTIRTNESASAKLDSILVEEQRQSADERASLLAQITNLINVHGKSQDQRLTSSISNVRAEILAAKETLETSHSSWVEGMGSWDSKEASFMEEVWTTREQMKGKLKDDWMVANTQHSSIQGATKSVHEQTVKIVDEQIKAIDIQMRALDDFVTRARSHNTLHHDVHTKSLKSLSSTAKVSYESISTQLTSTYDRTKSLGEDISSQHQQMQAMLPTLELNLCQPLTELRETIERTHLREYEPSGETPQKTLYEYPSVLPRTETRQEDCSEHQIIDSPSRVVADSTMSDGDELASLPDLSGTSTPHKLSQTTSGLREINVNLFGQRNSAPEASSTQLSASAGEDNTVPLLRRSTRDSGKKTVKKPSVVTLEGRENVAISQIPTASQAEGRRRSPRTVG